MQYSTVFLALLATAASAAPAPTTVSAMAEVKPWIIKSFTRSCSPDDKYCTIKFDIDTQVAPATHCEYIVSGNPASRTSASATCGPYAVTSNWSGQFGEGRGFTTWAVVDYSKNLITWPSYADTELVNGKAVVPDKSYAPAKLF